MSDIYSEVGCSQLRRLVHQDPEWAVNRLVAERERADRAEAEVAKWKWVAERVAMMLKNDDPRMAVDYLLTRYEEAQG